MPGWSQRGRSPPPAPPVATPLKGSQSQWALKTLTIRLETASFCRGISWRMENMNSIVTAKLICFVLSSNRFAYKRYSCSQNHSIPGRFPIDFFGKQVVQDWACKIERCVNSMLSINQNMIVSRGLELILSIFRRTTLSGQHPLILDPLPKSSDADLIY